jgi:regulator of protease activity HflC (stomatin/prohibitin superfamily)
MVAEAEAEAVAKVTKAIQDSGGSPTGYLIALKYIEAMKEMVSGKDNKVVYMPYEASALLGSVGSIRDLFVARPH